jgi:hypothetical protein
MLPSHALVPKKLLDVEQLMDCFLSSSLCRSTYVPVLQRGIPFGELLCQHLLISFLVLWHTLDSTLVMQNLSIDHRCHATSSLPVS